MMTHTPLWISIADTLRSEIVSGHYRAGDKLPTEAEFSARFGVNRHTLRRALACLADEGLVHARRGAGVFVTSAPRTYRLERRTRFRHNIQAAGETPHYRVLSLETRSSDAAEAEALRLPRNQEVHVKHALNMGDATPVSLTVSVFSAARFPTLPEIFANTPSTTEALRQAGLPDYLRQETEITATIATATQAGHLLVNPGAPLIRTTNIDVDPDGVPVEYGRTWFAGERVNLIVKTD